VPPTFSLKLRLLLISALSLSASLLLARQAQPQREFAFTHVNVIDGITQNIRPDYTVTIRGGRIQSIEPSAASRLTADAEVIDGRGKFLIPGLWDLHVHTRYEGIDHLRLFITHGITGVRDMGAEWAHLDRMRGWQREIADGRRIGPYIVPVGPLLDGPGSQWTHAHIVNNPDEGRSVVRRLKAADVRFAKVYALLSRDSFHAIADEAKQQGLTVTGHLPQFLGAAEASDARQRTIEHAYELFVSTSRREEDIRRQSPRAPQTEIISTYDPAKAQTLFERFKRNRTAILPALSLTAIRARVAAQDPTAITGGDLLYVPASYRDAWKGETPRSRAALDAELRHSIELVRQANRAGVEVLAGTDVVKAFFIPGPSLHDELALLFQAGLPPMQVLQSATAHAASLAGERERGSIAVGKVADLVLLSANPLEDIRNTRAIAGVMAVGRYFDEGTIRTMLGQIRADATAWTGTPTGR
jgi:imidazolonepropionase-like amidohydrolase